MRLSNYGWLCLLVERLGVMGGVIGAVIIGGACSGGTQRTHTAGSGAEIILGGSSDAAPVDKVPLSQDGSGAGNGSAGGSQLTGKSLEQCTDEKKAWRAVVDSGKSPAECTEALVAWCCTRNEVLARFPTAATKLDAEFSRYIDNDKHVLYHCSTDGVSRTTFHMAKVDGARVYYRTLYVEKLFPVETGHDGNCPEVTTKDLSVSSTSTVDPGKDEAAETESAEED